MIGALSRALITTATRYFHLGKVYGVENLPDHGPYIIVANHASFMDHFVIATLLKLYRKERVYYLTKKESFETLIKRIWHLSVGCIPLNRNAADTAAFRAVLRYLSEDKIICIYPEGTRSFTGKMMPGKSGAIKLAMLGKVPIVPIGLEGTFDILPKNRLKPRRHRATVRIGAPICFDQSDRKRDVEKITMDIMQRIAELSHELGEAYRCPPDDPSTQVPTIDHMLRAANEWNELGIRQSLNSPIPPNVLFHRAEYIAHEVLKRNPDEPRAYFERGRAIGRLALESGPVRKLLLAYKARKDFETAIRLNGGFPHAHYALGLWYLSIPKLFGGNIEKALEEYRLAVQLAPNEVYIYMGLGNCQLKLNRYEEAQSTYLRILELESSRPEDVRRKLEAAAQLLRMDPHISMESRVINACFNGLQNG